MKLIYKIATSIVATLILLHANQTFAGTNCKSNNKDPKIYLQAARQAVKLNQQLNKTKAKVVLISRVGADLSKYHLHYSHMGYAIKDYPGRAGKWTVIHLLNKCGTNISTIQAQGLMNFFLDDLYKMDFQITVPAEVLQERLNRALRSSLIHRIHEKHYNMLAFPFSTKYQNSNQWIIELFEATKINSTSRVVVQKHLLAHGYKPSIITVGGFSKLGVSLFKANIRFDDHPRDEQRSSRYSVVTVDSIIQYLKKSSEIVWNKEVQ